MSVLCLCRSTRATNPAAEKTSWAALPRRYRTDKSVHTFPGCIAPSSAPDVTLFTKRPKHVHCLLFTQPSKRMYKIVIKPTTYLIQLCLAMHTSSDGASCATPVSVSTDTPIATTEKQVVYCWLLPAPNLLVD